MILACESDYPEKAGGNKRTRGKAMPGRAASSCRRAPSRDILRRLSAAWRAFDPGFGRGRGTARRNAAVPSRNGAEATMIDFTGLLLPLLVVASLISGVAVTDPRSLYIDTI